MDLPLFPYLWSLPSTLNKAGRTHGPGEFSGGDALIDIAYEMEGIYIIPLFNLESYQDELSTYNKMLLTISTNSTVFKVLMLIL